MAIERLGPREILRMRAAGRVAAQTLERVGQLVQPGVTTLEIDRAVRQDTAERGAKPSQLGYHGFPAAVCTSVNEIACHGIPSAQRTLEDGDIISIDVTSNVRGFHGDNCATFFVGTPSAEARHLVEVAEQCRALGIAEVRPGARLGDVGAAIEEHANRNGCSVVTEVGGHGIGRAMHMDPHVTHVGPRGRRLRLTPGLAFTIEPIITLGRGW